MFELLHRGWTSPPARRMLAARFGPLIYPMACWAAVGYNRCEQKVSSPPVDRALWVKPTPDGRLSHKAAVSYARVSPEHANDSAE